MQNTVYRASRIPFLYAAFLLACAVQVWHAPAAHYSHWCCAVAAGQPSTLGLAVSGLFNALQSPLWGYLVLALLGFDGVQELCKRPMCFPVNSVMHKAAAVLLGVGILGVLTLAYAPTLDVRLSIHGTSLIPSQLHRLTGSSSWATVGVLCKATGVLGVALALSFGRRPPGR
jgi:hypothetical protein